MSKKKKIVIIVCSIVAIIVLALSILSIWATHKIRSMNTVDEDDNYVLSSDGYYTTFYDAPPANLEYNGKTITLTNIETWQKRDGYAYLCYVKATFNISRLDDAERHWLVDEDFSCSAYLTSEENNIDFKKMTQADWTYDDNYMTLTYSTENWIDNVRHSFDNCKVTICADAEQEETYKYTNDKGETSDLHKTISFHCSKEFDTVKFSD